MDLRGRDLITTLDLSPEEVRGLLDSALELKRGERRAALENRVAALLFFNPSVRTRISCESAMARYGGTAIAINPGKDTWNFECGRISLSGSSSRFGADPVGVPMKTGRIALSSFAASTEPADTVSVLMRTATPRRVG